jgi:uncharacterized protein
MIFDLFPKGEQFYDELEQLGGHVATAAGELANLAAALPAWDGHQERIAEEDVRADKVAQESLLRLDAAFITPLDREDILHLITDLYTVVETIAAIAKRAKLYHLQKLEPGLVGQVQILRDVAGCVSEVMRRLRKDHRLSTLNGQLKELHGLERRADEQRNAFLERLFQGTPDPLEVMKQKELHDLLELAIANCENVSRTLQRVVLKNS